MRMGMSMTNDRKNKTQKLIIGDHSFKPLKFHCSQDLVATKMRLPNQEFRQWAFPVLAPQLR